MRRFFYVLISAPLLFLACGGDESDDGDDGGAGGKKDSGLGGQGGTGGAGATGGVSGNGGVAGSGAVAGAGGSAGGAGLDGGAGASGAAGSDAGPPLGGDTCADPIIVGAVPFSANGTTVGAASDYGFGANACPPEVSATGATAPDRVYTFTPTTSGKYLVHLTGQNFDSTLYVVTDCANIDTTCLAGDDDVCTDCTESVSIDATANTTYYIIVDGFENTGAPTPGAYTLEVNTSPTNDTCSSALPITSIPFTIDSDSTGAGADYGFAANSCPGVASASGAGTSDLRVQLHSIDERALRRLRGQQ